MGSAEFCCQLQPISLDIHRDDGREQVRMVHMYRVGSHDGSTSDAADAKDDDGPRLVLDGVDHIENRPGSRLDTTPQWRQDLEGQVCTDGHTTCGLDDGGIGERGLSEKTPVNWPSIPLDRQRTIGSSRLEIALKDPRTLVRTLSLAVVTFAAVRVREKDMVSHCEIVNCASYFQHDAGSCNGTVESLVGNVYVVI